MTLPALPPCRRPRRPGFARRPPRCCSPRPARAPQFKVVGADGKVTYTDREPSQPEGRVTALGAQGAGRRPPSPTCPFDLRQVGREVPGHALHDDRRVRALQRRRAST